MIDTREAALGLFQDTLSRANTAMTNAMRAISASIDTSGLLAPEDYAGSISENAGLGSLVTDFVVPVTERGRGLGRIYHVFNNSPAGGKRLAKAIVWDWPGDAADMEITDAGGTPLRFQVMEDHARGVDPNLWSHHRYELAVEVDVEPYGYATIVLTERRPERVACAYPRDIRVMPEYCYRMENDRVAVEFDPMNMEITSFTDKRSGEVLLKNAGFRYVKEDPTQGRQAWTVGSAWQVGRYMDARPMENVKIMNSELGDGVLRQWINYTCTCGRSSMEVTVSLDDGAAEVCYEAVADWTEIGTKDTFVPQLQYGAALGYDPDEYLYDVPFGVISRRGIDHDVPGQTFACAKNRGGSSAAIFSKTKYGYKGFGGRLALNLIHSTFNPDPYPEIGVHKFEFAVGAADAAQNAGLLRRSAAYDSQPLVISGGAPHPGPRGKTGALLRLDGGVILSAVKLAEDGAVNRIIARVYEPDGKDAEARLSFGKPVKAARLVDALERPVGGEAAVSGDDVEFTVKAYKAAAVEVEF